MTHDLAAIEREYRTGQLSNRELGRQQGVSEAAVRKWAKLYGWTRDLSAAVRNRVREELVRDAVRANGCELMGVVPSDAAIVDEAAGRGVAIVRIHRRDIQATRQAVADLLEEVATAGKLCEVSTDEGVPVAKPLLRVTDRAQVIAYLSQALARLVPMERIAWALDDGEPTEKTYEERLRALCSG